MEKLLSFINEHGFKFEPELDGTWYTVHCQKTDSKLRYKGRVDKDGNIDFIFGKWSTPDKLFKYKDETFKKLSKEQRDILKQKRIERWNKSKLVAKAKFQTGTDTPSCNDNYLTKKGISPLDYQGMDVRWGLDNQGAPLLFVPMSDWGSEIWNIQFIQKDSFKSNISGARGKGLFFTTGVTDSNQVLLCEGFATTLSVHKALPEHEAICFFGLNNVAHVLLDAKKKGINKKFILCLDNDEAGRAMGAKMLKRWENISVVYPKTENFDFNDEMVKNGVQFVRNILVNKIMYSYIKTIDSSLDTPENNLSQNNLLTKHDSDGVYVGDISTFDTGFHTVKHTDRGPIYTPNYKDLVTYFSRKHNYRIYGESRLCMRWTGTHYAILSDVFIEEFAQKHFFPTAKNNMISEFKGLVLRTNVTPVEFFTDTVHKKINFLNGYMDIQSGKFCAHNQNIGFRYVLPYNYDANATCPQFDAFMKRITCNDKHLEETILEYFGYAMSGDFNWAQKMMILVGSGANGKSTLINVMRKVFGEENTSGLSARQFNDANSLNIMDGKLINMAEETPKKAFMEADVVKNIVTGGVVHVKRLYKDKIEIRLSAKLLLSCNEIPNTWDSTDAFYRRLIIAPFNAKFKDTDEGFDPFLDQKLEAELAGIANRVLNAYRTLIKRGRFDVAKSALETLEQYKRDSDYLLTWADETLQVHPLGNGHDIYWVSVDTLFKSYKEFCLAADIEGMNKFSFSKNLRRIWNDYDNRKGFFGPENERKRGFKGITRYNGIEFKATVSTVSATVQNGAQRQGDWGF